MIWDFHVGQQVACIYNGPRKNIPGAVYAQFGIVYTVRDIFTCPCSGALVLLLEEIVNPLTSDGLEYGFRATAFRPVKPTSIEVFRRLLKPVNDKVSA